MRQAIAALAAILCAGALQAEDARGTQQAVPDDVWSAMQGTSWHADMPCPARDDLRLLTIPYVDFYGDRRDGRMIVSAEVADDLLSIFADILTAGYPIQSMRLVQEFGGDDGLSMAANNTSAFNCRLVAGTDRLSQHALGKALDINPVQNPYVTRSGVSPAAGVDFDEPHERKADVPGVITADHPVVRAFKARGWGWGGDWSASKDYQHFSESGK